MQNNIGSKSARDFFKKIYSSNTKATKRYQDLLEAFIEQFGKPLDYAFFSSPGRVEIIGNHTDHNLGKVIAASIDLDTIAVACKNNTNLVRLKSLSYNEYLEIDLEALEPQTFLGSKELVKGLFSAIRNKGYLVEGLDICVDSLVLAGSGMSSSASFAMLICEIVNSFYNEEKMTILEMAQFGKYAENNYWHKKSGLLDEIACANGGMIAIDFENTIPVIKKLDASSLTDKLAFLVVQTGKTHEDLSDLYSTIPNDMYEIARYFKKETLSEVSETTFYDNFKAIKKQCSDRAILRAVHYFDENKRVLKMIEALKNGHYNEALKCIKESGLSSYEYLQNCLISDSSGEQPLAVTLMLTRRYLNTISSGVCRVHGGGFAGTILVVLPKKYKSSYIEYMKNYQNYQIKDLKIRSYGCINVSKYIEG